MSTDSTTSIDSVTDQFSNFTTGFTKFVKEQNIIGLALGIILAQVSIDLSKNLGNNVIKPVVRFLSGKDSSLSVDFEGLLTDLIVLGVTLIIIYTMINLLGIKPTVATSAGNIAVPLTI